MNNIILRRAVEVSVWRVIGQVAKAAKRAELIPMLIRIGERGESDARDIAGHLLFESKSRKVVAERLLLIATRYRLLEQHGSMFVLTDSGKQAIDTEEVFVPEDGTWTVWASDDPLLPGVILRVAPWSEPSAFAEVRAKKNDFTKERDFVWLPIWLLEIKGKAVKPAAGTGQVLRIDELASKGDSIEPEASLEFIWNVTAGRLSLEGRLDRQSVTTDMDPPGMSSEEVWRELLKGERLWADWDKARQALMVEFDDTSEPEREAMTKAVEFRRPDLADLGQFEPLTVLQVPIIAASLPDAQRWAEWRLNARVQDYATEPRFTAWSQEALAPFDEHRPNIPSRAELAEKAWRSRATRPSPQVWHLVAAEDWRL